MAEKLKTSAEVAVQATDLVEASATSHLRNVRLPGAPGAAEDELEELPEVEAPKTLKHAHEALTAAHKETDPRIRRHKVSQVTAHLHRLSQVERPAPLSVKDARNLARSQNDAAEEMLLEMIGRQYPVVKKRIGELEAEILSLKQPKPAAQKQPKPAAATT